MVTALIANGRYVSSKPSRALKSSRTDSRNRATLVQSISIIAAACGIVVLDTTIAFAIALRICVSGIGSSPAIACGISGWAGAAAGRWTCPGWGCGCDCIWATYCSTSWRVTRPFRPVPCTRSRSTPCSVASRRTTGVARMSPFCDGGAATGADGRGAAGAGGVGAACSACAAWGGGVLCDGGR